MRNALFVYSHPGASALWRNKRAGDGEFIHGGFRVANPKFVKAAPPRLSSGLYRCRTGSTSATAS